MDGQIAYELFNKERKKAWEEYRNLPEFKSILDGIDPMFVGLFRLGFETGYAAKFEAENK